MSPTGISANPKSSSAFQQSLVTFRETHAKKTLTFAGDTWEYCIGGRGYPTVIVSGAGAGAESMFTVNVALESRARVISVGIPGSVVTADQVAAGIRAILDSLGVQKAILLGHSLGGMVVQAFTIRNPERVAGLVLCNTGFFVGIRRTVIPYCAKVLSHFPDALVLSMIAYQTGGLLKEAPARADWKRFFADELRKPNEIGRLKRQMHLMDDIMNSFRVTRILPSLPWVPSLPVQIIASADDRGFTTRETALLKNIYPNSQILILTRGANHLSFATRPEEFCEVVLRFMDRVEQGAQV